MIQTNKKKMFVIGLIVAILLLNVVWTVLQNKFTPKVDELKAGMLRLEQRINKLESSGISDIATLKEEFANLKVFSDSFSENLSESLKIEEERLATLQSQVEAQKTRIEALKKIAQ